MKVSFLVGAGVGYVLGARAGRARYEQLMRAVHSVMENPKVQSAAGSVQSEAFALADKAKNTFGPKVGWHPDNHKVTITVTQDAHRNTPLAS
jgi:hypothetical protein